MVKMMIASQHIFSRHFIDVYLLYVSRGRVGSWLDGLADSSVGLAI
jgi:hypothetical protein